MYFSIYYIIITIYMCTCYLIRYLITTNIDNDDYSNVYRHTSRSSVLLRQCRCYIRHHITACLIHAYTYGYIYSLYIISIRYTSCVSYFKY